MLLRALDDLRCNLLRVPVCLLLPVASAYLPNALEVELRQCSVLVNLLHDIRINVVLVKVTAQVDKDMLQSATVSYCDALTAPGASAVAGVLRQ